MERTKRKRDKHMNETLLNSTIFSVNFTKSRTTWTILYSRNFAKQHISKVRNEKTIEEKIDWYVRWVRCDVIRDKKNDSCLLDSNRTYELFFFFCNMFFFLYMCGVKKISFTRVKKESISESPKNLFWKNQ